MVKPAPAQMHRPWLHTMDPSGRFLVNADGVRLNRFEWPCATPSPRALLFIAHGGTGATGGLAWPAPLTPPPALCAAGEHIRRYDELALLLGKHNYFVFAHDHVRAAFLPSRAEAQPPA